MPTVPSNFVPQVNMQGESSQVPLQAPGVTPVQNLAADQQVQFGNSMVRAGNTMYDVASDIEDTINDARAREADVAIQNKVGDALYGQNGYMNTLGKDAETNFAPTQSNLNQIANDVIDGLSNDTQKGMVRLVARRNLNTYNDQINKHRNQQSKIYLVGESEARISSYTNLAANSYSERFENNDYIKNIAVVFSDTRKLGRMAGLPEDSEQMKQMERSAWGGIVTGVVQKLSLTNGYDTAMAFVEEQNGAGNLTPETYQRLSTYVDGRRDDQMANEYADSIINEGIIKSGATPHALKPIVESTQSTITSYIGKGNDRNHIVQIEDAVGTKIYAPADAVITEVTTLNGFTDLKLVAKDGSKIAISGIVNNAKYSEDTPVSQGQPIGVIGNRPVEYTVQRNGAFIDPLTTDQVDVAEKPTKPSTSLQEALNIAGEISNQELRWATQQRIKVRWEDISREKQAMETKTYLQAAEIIASGEIVPYDLLAQLSPESRATLGKKIQELKDNVVELDALQNPAKFTHAYLQQIQNTISPQLFLQLWKKANDPGELESAQVDAEQLNATLYRNGFPALARPSSGNNKEQAAALYLRESIRDQIVVQQKNWNKLTRKEVREQVQVIIDENLMNLGTKTGWFYDSSGGVPVASLSRSEQAKLDKDAFVPIRGIRIPIADYKGIYNSFIKANDREPSDFELLGAYKKYIINMFTEKYGRKPSDLELSNELANLQKK